METLVDNEINITLKNILDYFYSKCSNHYIPALINEGNLLSNGTELYVKLMSVNREVNIDKTWFKNNLIVDGNDKCFNIITLLNYNMNDLYTLNPNILDNNYITMLEPKSDFCTNLEYYKGDRISRNKVLVQDDKNILVYFPAIEDYSGVNDFVPNYDLYIELEYRTLNNNLFPDRLGKFNTEYGVVDLIYDVNDFSKQKGEKQYWLRASIKLDLERLNLKSETSNYGKIKVVDLNDRKIRDLNLGNYNDDMGAGLIVFSTDIVEVLQEYYYFYDLILIPKISGLKECLVDYIEDYIVFWEGEFNSNVPLELKEKMVKFNVTNKTENLISPSMFEWQLNGKWNYHEKLLPSQKLAYFLRNNYFNIALENEIDFYPPQNIEQYSKFVKKILNITNLRVDNLNLEDSKKELLIDIIELKHIFKDKHDLFNNYQGLCYLFTKVLGYGKN